VPSHDRRHELRNLLPGTQRSYPRDHEVSRYFGHSPDGLGLEDMRAFQSHLVSLGISCRALNQTVCALHIFFGVTLDRAEIKERPIRARRASCRSLAPMRSCASAGPGPDQSAVFANVDLS
jgi:hypothetical protein